MGKLNIPKIPKIKQRNKKANRLNIKCKMRDAEIEHTENPQDQTTKQKKQINSTSSVKCVMLKVNIPEIQKIKQRNKKTDQLKIECRMHSETKKANQFKIECKMCDTEIEHIKNPKDQATKPKTKATQDQV